MSGSPSKQDSELYIKLKWLMFCRVVFNTLLLGSTIIVQVGKNFSPSDKSLSLLYVLIGCIYLLSFIYIVLINHIKNEMLVACIQIAIDTVIVSLIIYLTGCYVSLFSFLYLIVIIYSSMLLYRKGIIVTAVFCCIQYGIMVDLEYYGVLKPFGPEENLVYLNYEWSQIVYKILTIMVACFAIAFLSSLLSEQARESKKELIALESHVKRVEKMAAIGEMVAGLAHEIKNPLASLRGSIQFLKDELPYDPSHDRLMQIVLREADRLSSLVNDFLIFARPPAGKVERIDLEKTIPELLELFQKDFKYQERITFFYEITSGIQIEIDPTHLKQIMWNLLLNATESIKDKGNIDIHIYPAKSKYVAIKITDNGCGMSKETMKSIFTPFFTTKPNGTGLGLSIIHRIVESYHGRIDIESEETKGTSFILKLLRADEMTNHH